MRKVLVLHSDVTVKRRQIYHPQGKEMLEIIKDVVGGTQIAEDDEEEFLMALEKFAEAYSLPSINWIKMENERKFGLLSQPHLKALKSTLEKNAARRVQKIKEQLAKDQPDFWIIACEAWLSSDYYFVLPSSAVMPETGLIKFIDGALYEPFPVYITKTFTIE